MEIVWFGNKRKERSNQRKPYLPDKLLEKNLSQSSLDASFTHLWEKATTTKLAKEKLILPHSRKKYIVH